MLKFIIVIITLSNMQNSFAESMLIENKWRYPTSSDLKWDWIENVENYPTPYYATGDYNGDSVLDEAWITIDKNNPVNWRLYALISSSTGKKETYLLDESINDIPPQGYGITNKKAGQYNTACAKGYGTSKECKFPKVDLKFDGIDLFRFESSSSFFFWDAKTKSFIRVWESD